MAPTAHVGVTGWLPVDRLQPVHTIRGPKPKSLAAFICGVKLASAKRINALRNKMGAPFWQRNYYEHIIRNEAKMDKIRNYIIHNQANWALDKENPKNQAKN